MSAPTGHDVVNALLAVALVFAWQSRRAPSVTMLLLCALTWRMLPSTEGEGRHRRAASDRRRNSAAADGAAGKTAVIGRERKRGFWVPRVEERTLGQQARWLLPTQSGHLAVRRTPSKADAPRPCPS